MKICKITVIRKASYPDLMAQYENPLENACDMQEGMIFYSENGQKPEGLCNNAWNCMRKYVETLANGGGNFFDGWMKNPYSAMVSCDDGFRPVTYYIEALEET